MYEEGGRRIEEGNRFPCSFLRPPSSFLLERALHLRSDTVGFARGSIMTTELVPDPVGHISISGVHGRDELKERLANAPTYQKGRTSPLPLLLLGAALGAGLMYLLRRE
jgi:hypothetical protein